MITLKISLLLLIDLKDDTRISHTRKKFTKPVLKNKFKQTSEMSLIQENAIYSVCKIQNPLKFIHIDYILFPKKFQFAVDVVCWGPVAKISTRSGTKFVKTIIEENFVWIPVCIEHYLNPLPNEEIRNFLNQIITVNFTIGKDSVSLKEKFDKLFSLYMFKEDGTKMFPEMYTEKPNNDSDSYLRKEVERILKKLQCFPINREIITWIYNMDSVHSYKFEQIIRKHSQSEEIFCKEFYNENDFESNIENEFKKKKKGNRNSVNNSYNNSRKSSKTKKNIGRKNLILRFPASVLLTDPVLALYRLKETSSELVEAYILLSSDNILTSLQKQQLCPLVINLKKINNLPASVLTANGFEKTFLCCIIPGITEFNTSLKPIASTVRFDESTFVITSDVSSIKTLEILETKRVMVKLVGIKEVNKPMPLKNKIKKISKKKKSKQSSSRSSKASEQTNSTTSQERITLALTAFDLSSLSKTFFLFREKGSCYTPSSRNVETSLGLHFTDRITINELNLIEFQKESMSSPLTDSLLLLKGTTVKLEAHFLQPMYPLFYTINTACTFSRLLVIFFKRDVAESFLSAILQHNREFLGSGPLFIPNFLVQKCCTQNSDTCLKKKMAKMLSGFIIDDGNSFTIYVEGPSNGHILNLLHQISKIDYSTGKVFYNSHYMFAERIYSTFYKFSGYFLITLKIPLSNIFAQARTYISGNIPLPCFSAIKKINLIFNSTTFKEILNHDLLPNEVELLALDVEYGFKLRYSAKGLNEIVSSSTANTQRDTYKIFL